MAANRADPNDLVNCHFSVNQQALISVIKPMMSELAQEWGYESRLSSLEKSQGMLQKEVALKAEAAGIQGMRKELQEHLQQLQQKANQSALATMQAQLRSVESTVSWKADQSALEEVTRSAEIATKHAETKADQSGLNRVLAAAQKLQTQVLQIEKIVQDSQGRIQKLEMHNLPGHAQRVSDQLGKTRAQLQKIHDVLATKVDARDLEALANATKELQTAVALKVGPQSLHEIRSMLRDMQLKLDLKVDAAVAEELQAGLNRLQSQLTQKAQAQELREAASTIQSLRANLDGKVDFALLSDVRVKVQTLETCLDKKTDSKDIQELGWLKETVVQKAERRQVSELSSAVERLQQELHFSLENDRAAFRRELEARVEKMDQLERDIQNAMACVEGLTAKVDATPRPADTTSPRGTASPRGSSPRGSSPPPEKGAFAAVERLETNLRQAMHLLDGKVDRSEIEDLVLATSVAEQQQATVSKVADLEGQLQTATDSLRRKVDRREIEELLNAAAEAAAEGISGSMHDGMSGSDPLLLAEPVQAFPAQSPGPNVSGVSEEAQTLKDPPTQHAEKIAQASNSQNDGSSNSHTTNSANTTPRMKGSASAPSSSHLLGLSAPIARHTRSGSVGLRGGKAKKPPINRVTGLPTYPAKTSKMGGWR
mmetsp:Transcript_31775/g.68373  ORF Transcript_31775/g.68373 Transcript_31775/m.68373 type:complete len:656 (+) Transcript_31775:50-2017(+)